MGVKDRDKELGVGAQPLATALEQRATRQGQGAGRGCSATDHSSGAGGHEAGTGGPDVNGPLIPCPDCMNKSALRFYQGVHALVGVGTPRTACKGLCSWPF